MPKIKSSRRFLSSIRQSTHPFSVTEHETISNLKTNDLIDSIQQHLKNGLPSERTIGTEMVSTFISGTRLSSLSLNQWNGLIKSLGLLLVDRAENVRLGAIDALSYLSSLSDNICDQMFNNNILESIMKFFENHFLKLNLNDTALIEKKSLTIYVECFNLLTNLCGSSSRSISFLISQSFIDILIHSLRESLTENEAYLPVLVSVLQSLSVISEDEQAYSKIIKNESITQCLTAILLKLETNSSSKCIFLYLKLLIISIAFNGCLFEPESNSKEELLHKFSSIFLQIFKQSDISANCKSFVFKIQQDLSSEVHSLEQMQNDYFEIRYYLLTKRACFELLTNLSSFDSNEELDDDEDMEYISGDDEEMGCDMKVDQTKLDPLICQLISQIDIANIIITELSCSIEKFTCENSIGSLRQHIYGKDIVSLFVSSKIACLSLLHNLVSLNLADIQSRIFDLWPVIYQLAFQSHDENELRDESLNVVRELFLNSKEINITMDDLQCLCQYSISTISRVTKINIIRIIALVGCNLLNDKNNSNVSQPLEQITNLLLAAYQNESNDLVFHAELLDSLIDIYADDNPITLSLIKKLKLISLFKEMSSKYFKEMKTNKAIVRQNAVVSTVGLNLNRFIKYKQKHL